jgi:diguanylate cyclase (GGDEF)-like protein
MMQEAQFLLTLGTVIMGCGCLGMLTVRLCSPGLQGTGWLSGAFAGGSAGAALLLVLHAPLLSIFAADMALLSSFVLLHVAVLKVVRSTDVRISHGFVLLGIQAVVDLLRMEHVVRPEVRIAWISLLVAAQSATTALTLWRSVRHKVRAPAIFSALLLLTFATFNVVRSVIVEFGLITPLAQFRLGLVVFALYIAVALGLAFGFFWITTAVLNAELEHMASTDPLTRLYNRRVFLKWCDKELMRTQRSSVAFSVLLVDIDHFKRINDNFGHHRGDQVLCAAVERMQDSIRGIDVLCRWGGEEFAVLLPNASAASTLRVAERIRQNVQKVDLSFTQQVAAPGEMPVLTVSIGSATYRDLDDDVASMLMRADEALYRAKAAGRNRVVGANLSNHLQTA